MGLTICSAITAIFIVSKARVEEDKTLHQSVVQGVIYEVVFQYFNCQFHKIGKRSLSLRFYP